MQIREIIEIDFEQAITNYSPKNARATSWTEKLGMIIGTALDYVIYTLVFLMPLFFLPTVHEHTELGKQALLFGGVAIISILYLTKLLLNKRLKAKFGLPIIVLGLTFIAWTVATVFSPYRHASLWGINSLQYESLLTVSLLIGLLKISSSHLSLKKINIALYLLLASSCATSILTILQLCSVFILPFDVSQTKSFNTIGSLLSAGGFSVIALLVAVNKLIQSTLSPLSNKLPSRIVLSLASLINLSLLIIINHWSLWLSLATGLTISIAILLKKTTFKSFEWIILPGFLAMVSLTSALIATPKLLPLPQQANLSLSASTHIANQTIKNRPLLGVGPSNFVLASEAYRPIELNREDFQGLWQVRIEHSGSAVLGKITDTGIVGIIALFAVMVVIGKRLIDYMKTSQVNEESLTVTTITSTIVGASAIALLIPGNMTLEFTTWLLLSGLVHFLTNTLVISSANNKKVFWAISVFMLISLLAGISVGGYYFVTLRLIPDTYYSRALSNEKSLSDNQNSIEAMINNLQVASLSKNDIYLRKLSQTYLAKINSNIQNIDPATLKALTEQAINAGKLASDRSPLDSRNHTTLGIIYTAILPLSTGADVFAVEHLQRAIELEPNHPENHVNLARAYLTQSEQGANVEMLNRASEELVRAVDLKPNYAQANFFKALIAIQQKNTQEALTLLDKVMEDNYSLISTQTADQELFYYTGLGYKTLGEMRKAESAFVVSIKSGSNKSIVSLATWELIAIAEEKGDYSNAIAMTEKLLSDNPENPTLTEKLSQLKQLRGE